MTGKPGVDLRLVGRFGLLRVVGEDVRSDEGKTRWRVVCDCGRATVVIGTLLNTGRQTSCGCRRGNKDRMK